MGIKIVTINVKSNNVDRRKIQVKKEDTLIFNIIHNPENHSVQVDFGHLGNLPLEWVDPPSEGSSSADVETIVATVKPDANPSGDYTDYPYEITDTNTNVVIDPIIRVR